MKKRILAFVLSVCLLIPFCVSAFADTDKNEVPCLHENAKWELLAPATLLTNSYYVRECPDCGFRQVAKKARTAVIENAFDLISRFFFMLDKPVLTDDFTVTAHTGPGELPMNSMLSLIYSLQSGADIVEFDLALDSDGVAVMSHDPSEGAGGTLEEGFALVAKYVGVRVNVDVKTLAAVEQAQALAVKYGIADRIFYTGVSADKIGYVKEHSPLVPCYINCSCGGKGTEYYEDLCDKALSLGAVGLNFSYTELTPELSEIAHEKGLLVSVYTVNSAKDMRACLKCSPDNITTEFPYKLYTMTGGYRDTFC